MPSLLANSPLLIVALMFAIAGVWLIVAGMVALRRGRPLRFGLRALSGLFLVACGLISGLLAVGLQGYQALTHEELAAHLTVRPLGSQQFSATVRYADGRESVHEIAGDEIYIDAHILKWRPIANVLGLHTAYELDRISGRYRSVEQERTGRRTIHLLAQEKRVDLFDLRQRYAVLAPFLDAEYGSATFVPVNKPAEFEVRVSTTGLLLREVPAK